MPLTYQSIANIYPSQNSITLCKAIQKLKHFLNIGYIYIHGTYLMIIL